MIHLLGEVRVCVKLLMSGRGTGRTAAIPPPSSVPALWYVARNVSRTPTPPYRQR